MRYGFTLLVVGLAIAPAPGAGQAARIGRLPILEVPPAGVGTCRNDPINAALKHAGIARLLSIESNNASSHRLISLGLDAKGGAVMLMALMGTNQGRRGESESVDVFLGKDGSIVRGHRSAFTTGTPTRLSDDRQRGLLAADTLGIRHLIAALRQRCRA